MEIKKFNEYEPINESVFSFIKGALSKVFNLFAAPFKDLASDIKKMFKEDDLGTIKDIIMTNFNQAIDSMQKEIPNITEEGALTDLMPKMITQLVELSNNIEKDVSQGLGKEKTSSFTNAARSVLMGNKEAKWPGIVGALDPNNAEALKYNGGIKINYKLNKEAYDKALTEAGAKGGKDVLKAKKDAATKFLDNLQKDVTEYIERELTDDELREIYTKAGGKITGGGEMTYDKLKELFDKKTPVIYLLKGKKKEEYDPKKKPEDQAMIVGVKPIESLNDQNKPDSVVFLDKNGKPTIKKSYVEIIGPGSIDTGENAKKATEVLGKIKQDEEKMGKVVKFAEFMQDDKNKDKIAEIEKIIGG